MVRTTIKVIPNRGGQRRAVTPGPSVGVPIDRSPAPTLSIRVEHMASTPTPMLSILIPTVPGREAKLASLLSALRPQLHDDVELIIGYDERTMTVGEKRNRLIAAASGEYVAFVDDDDMVTTHYVEAILGGLVGRPDVLTFRVLVLGYGAPKECIYGLHLRDENLPNVYHRRPNHLMVWRRELASTVPFPHVKIREDSQWAREITKRASIEFPLTQRLYTYQFDPKDNSGSHR